VRLHGGVHGKLGQLDLQLEHMEGGAAAGAHQHLQHEQDVDVLQRPQGDGGLVAEGLRMHAQTKGGCCVRMCVCVRLCDVLLRPQGDGGPVAEGLRMHAQTKGGCCVRVCVCVRLCDVLSQWRQIGQ